MACSNVALPAFPDYCTGMAEKFWNLKITRRCNCEEDGYLKMRQPREDNAEVGPGQRENVAVQFTRALFQAHNHDGQTIYRECLPCPVGQAMARCYSHHWLGLAARSHDVQPWLSIRRAHRRLH